MLYCLWVPNLYVFTELEEEEGPVLDFLDDLLENVFVSIVVVVLIFIQNLFNFIFLGDGDTKISTVSKL